MAHFEVKKVIRGRESSFSVESPGFWFKWLLIVMFFLSLLLCSFSLFKGSYTNEGEHLLTTANDSQDNQHATELPCDSLCRNPLVLHMTGLMWISWTGKVRHIVVLWCCLEEKVHSVHEHNLWCTFLQPAYQFHTPSKLETTLAFCCVLKMQKLRVASCCEQPKQRLCNNHVV